MHVYSSTISKQCPLVCDYTSRNEFSLICVMEIMWSIFIFVLFMEGICSKCSKPSVQVGKCSFDSANFKGQHDIQPLKTPQPKTSEIALLQQN